MRLLIAVIALFSVPVTWSQPSFDDNTPAASRDITIEVDSTQTKNQDKSLGLALLGSAILPGAGEAYLSENKSARNFLLIEAGFWATVFVAFEARQSYLQSGRNFASEFAGASTAANMSATELENLASYRSYAEAEHRQDSYELNQVLSGQRDGSYGVSSTSSWDFGSSNTPENTVHWSQFQSVMRYYRASNVAISFAVGALALNRIVALAHTLRTYHRTSGKGLSVHFDPLIGPGVGGMRLATNF